MQINNFHIPGAEPPERPMRFYGLGVEDEAIADADEREGRYLSIDLIGADWFDSHSSEAEGGLSSPGWRSALLTAPVAALEINTRRRSAARELFETSDLGETRWHELYLNNDHKGGGELFRNLFGAGEPVSLKSSRLSLARSDTLQKSVSLDSFEVTDATIRSKLPSGSTNYLSVYDVGQGLAQGLLDSSGNALAYVDLGGGVLADVGTWPSAMTGFCFCKSPPVILSHWHLDHFSSANRYPRARMLEWIAPNQPLGPGAQSTFAAAVIANGTLFVWPSATPSLTTGNLKIELCTGTTQNTSGLAVIVNDPAAALGPIVLTGDAGYSHISSLKTRTPFSLVVPHHGGIAAGKATPDPGHGNSRVVVSCGGPTNSYGHPLPASITKLTASGWSLGHPGRRIDDRFCMDLQPSLGHVGLRWGGPVPAMATCSSCSCSIMPATGQW